MIYKITIHNLDQYDDIPTFERIKSSPEPRGKRIRRLDQKQQKLLARRQARKIVRV